MTDEDRCTSTLTIDGYHLRCERTRLHHEIHIVRDPLNTLRIVAEWPTDDPRATP